MICKKKCELLEKLVELFQPFDEFTTYFSGVNYSTISSILPLIEELKQFYCQQLKTLYNVKNLGKLYINCYYSNY